MRVNPGRSGWRRRRSRRSGNIVGQAGVAHVLGNAKAAQVSRVREATVFTASAGRSAAAGLRAHQHAHAPARRLDGGACPPAPAPAMMNRRPW